MNKKLIAFDLDDTLAPTKSDIQPRMTELLRRLIEHTEICIITGGRFEQVDTYVLPHLNFSEAALSRLHLLPLSGAQRYFWRAGTWQHTQYVQTISEADRAKLIRTIESTVKRYHFWETDPQGAIIEDRGTQITFSALGQLAAPADKYAWDPDSSKRRLLQSVLATELPEWEVNINGNTSIDITQKGLDKGYGMSRLLDDLSLGIEDVLFVGDQLQEAGNDYPIKALGIDTIAVNNYKQTSEVVEKLLADISEPTE